MVHIGSSDMNLEDYLLLCIRHGYNNEAEAVLEGLSPHDLIGTSGSILLHVAADCGNSIITRCLIEKGCNVDSVDSKGNTPLIFAIQQGHTDVASLLIKAKASVLITNSQGESAAEIVLGHSNIELDIVDEFLDRVKEECLNDSLLTAKKLLEFNCPLPRAVRLEDNAITKYMLESGCNVNEQDPSDCQLTALHQAVIFSDLENVKLLIDYGANVNAENFIGYRPLNFSCDQTPECLEILKCLLEHGAQLITDDGTLVAGHLFQFQEKETVEYLMEHDLDVSAKDKHGSTLLHYVIWNEKFDSSQIIKNYMNDSFNINEKSQSGSTLLISASRAGSVETVEFLLERGAEVNLVEQDGNSAINWALASDPSKDKANLKARTKIVMLLLQYGADVQCINNNEETLFDVIVLFKNFSMAKLILAHLAIMEDLGYEIKDLIFNKINSHVMFKDYYRYCKATIEKMKQKIIHDSVSLFQILTARETEILHFARDKLLVSKLQLMVDYKSYKKLYFFQVLQNQLMKMIEAAQLHQTDD